MEVLNFYKIGKTIPENAVYIGRENYNFNLQGSKFANPYKLSKDESRGATIHRYKKWLWQQLLEEKISKKDILSLEGKDLVCYCAPQPCHGNMLKSAFDYIKNNEKDFDEKLDRYKKIKKEKIENSKSNSKFKPLLKVR